MGGDDSGHGSAPVSHIERVRCLGCGIVYVKPSGGSTAPSGIACGAGPADEADPAEIMVRRRPDPNREAHSLQSLWEAIRKARLEMEEAGDGVETRTIHGIAGAQTFVEDAAQNLNNGTPQPRTSRGANRNP
jgi:hypothetical protein